MLSYSQNTILCAAVCIHFKSRSAYPNPKHINIHEFHDPNVFDNYQKTFALSSRIILIIVQSIC
jgi:hypothetical protein